MAKDKLTEAARKLGAAIGRAERMVLEAQKTAGATKGTLRKKAKAVARELKMTKKHLLRALAEARR